MGAARATRAASRTARRAQTEGAQKGELLPGAAADRAEQVVREAGLSAEAIAQMRREFLGVKS